MPDREFNIDEIIALCKDPWGGFQKPKHQGAQVIYIDLRGWEELLVRAPSVNALVGVGKDRFMGTQVKKVTRLPCGVRVLPRYPDCDCGECLMWIGEFMANGGLL